MLGGCLCTQHILLLLHVFLFSYQILRLYLSLKLIFLLFEVVLQALPPETKLGLQSVLLLGALLLELSQSEVCVWLA